MDKIGRKSLVLTAASFCCLLLAATVLHAQPASSDPFWVGSYTDPLSPSQRQWLADLGRSIRIGVTSIPPQVFYNPQNGQMSGLCIDYIRHIEHLLNYRFEVVYYASWAELMAQAFDRQVDIVYAAQRTPTREKYFLFSQPYLKFNNVIVTNEEPSRPLRLKDLTGKLVAVVRGSALEEFLKTNFPQLVVLAVEDEMAGLSRVSFGQADAMVVEIARASWYIRQNKFTNLYISGDAEYPFELGFACRNDWPQLVEIMNAALHRISPETRQAMLDRWLLPTPPSYRVLKGLLLALIAAVLASIAILIWNRLLHRRVRQRTEQLSAELKAHQLDSQQLRRYETIMSLTTDMMAFVDSHGIYQAANDAYLKALNKPRAAVIGKPSKDFFDPSFYAQRIAPRVAQALTGQTVRFEEWREFAGLGRRFISGMYYPSFGNGGAVEGIAIVLHDQTDQYRAFEQLQDSQQRLASIIAAAPVGIGVMFRHILASVNQLICLNTGYEENELLGKSIRALFVDLAEADRALNDIQRQIERRGIGSTETRWLRKDGRLIDVLLNVVPLDVADPEKGLTFAALDITDRKAAQTALEESRQAMERLINNMRGIMYRCKMTPDWPMEYISQGCLELTGYTDQEFYQNQITWGKLVVAEDKKRIFRQIAEAVAAKQPYQIEYRIVDRAGNIRWMWEKGCGVYDAQGELLALEGFITDMTDRKQAEQQLLESNQQMQRLVNEISQKNQELQSIVYIASHDLRSPLVNVRGFAGELEKSLNQLTELVRAASLPEPQRQALLQLAEKDLPESLAFIKKGSQKMDQLLNGLGRLSRVGSAPLALRRLDVAALLADVLANKQFAMRQNEADIIIEGDLPPCLGDPVLVSQVFENLIDNAVKFRHPERPCRVRIRGRQENSRCVYEIEDNGIGIEPQHQEKIFEIFHQLNPAAGGEGLGLTIVRRILQRQDGAISVRSIPGEGTTMIVQLPAAERGD